MIRQRYPENELKVEVMNHPVPQVKQVCTAFITLLMAQWVDMEALENKNHASLLCFFDSMGAIRRISSLE